jgi:hypothetical protein
VRAELAEEVAERMKKSTVRVVILSGDEVKGHGSGFIISSNGHVATNRHVIAEAETAVVIHSTGDLVYIRHAELVGVSDTSDLAILKIDPIPSTETVEIANTELVTGQNVTTVGFPGAIDTGAWATLEGVEIGSKSGEGRITSPDARSDFEPAVFSGAVAKIVTESGTCLVLHSAKISPGNSGGPLADAEGRVCGINTALVPASMAGADYPISIHASELITLARAHSVSIKVTSSKVSSGGGNLQVVLWIAVAAFAVVVFLLLLRKPRMAMGDTLSRMVHSKRQTPGHQDQRAPSSGGRPVPMPAAPNSGGLRLRGRDLQGRSYDLSFNQADFRRNGGRLVVGRSHDLSQLLVSHDSVSRQHVTLTLSGSTVLVDDRNSGNGTKINGRELAVGAPSVPLRPGDRLTLGEVDLIFEVIH